MGEFNGTPGPWRVLPEEMDKPYLRVRGTNLGLRYKIADVPSVVYKGAPEREAHETRANARLIAAAPALLEALRGCLEVMGRSFGNGKPVPINCVEAAAAFAAIRQATQGDKA